MRRLNKKLFRLAGNSKYTLNDDDDESIILASSVSQQPTILLFLYNLRRHRIPMHWRQK